jgi:hypothetical protein
MNANLFMEILYQIHLLEKILSKETNTLKRAKYEGMLEALLFVLEKENEI